MFGTEQIPLLEDKIANLNKNIGKLQATIRGLIQHGKKYEASIPSYFTNKLQANQRTANEILAAQSVHRFLPWNAPTWATWQPPMWDTSNNSGEEDFTPSTLRIGDLLEGRDNTGFAIPAMIPFVGKERTIIIETGAGQYESGLSLLQSLLIRTALMLPHQTTYTLLDPAHLGQSFPMRANLPHVQNSQNDVRRDLDLVTERIIRLNTTFLEHKAFHEISRDLRVNERFNLVFLADFPNGYDYRAVESLARICETGPRAGTYVFIHYNTEAAPLRDWKISDIKNAFIINPAAPIQVENTPFRVQLDTAPDRTQQNEVFQKLQAARPPERKIDFEGAIGLSEGQWWQENSNEMISTRVGAMGANGWLDVWLGETDRGVVAHGVLGGATGSGKSNLYHVLILGLALRYSPSELRFFLIDGKDGVSFQPYRHLPHAEVVSLKSSPQLSRNVLQELTLEQERRNEIFTGNRVVDLTQYRKLGQPDGKLPRILLLIDEYQELFEGDKDGLASQYLEQIARQGRSVGIHMILGSQGFVGVQGMLNRNAIFGNIHLRMAMNMPASDVQALTEFQRQGKQLVLACDLPGKIVVNHQSGNDGDNANQLGKVAFLTKEMRDTLIEKLNQKANAELAPQDNPITIVFDGKAQPNFIDNPQVEFLLQQNKWLSKDELQEVARRPLHAEGFSVSDWFSAENPKPIWLGQDFSVRGQAMMVIRRRLAENAMIIGGANAARYGMLGACISSLVLSSKPENIQFLILDRSVPGTDWNPTLSRISDTVLVPNGYKVTFYKENRDVERMLNELVDIMNARRNLPEEELMYEPDVICILTELDRVDNLRRPAGAYVMSESPLGDKLNRVIAEGPSLGIHVIMSFANVHPMKSVVDERHTLNSFRHRIALQMSEDESLTFVRSRKAATLQNEGPQPIVALYMDMDRDSSVRFKPYSIEATINYYDQMKQFGERISAWQTEVIAK